jgi:hypothetical protein
LLNDLDTTPSAKEDSKHDEKDAKAKGTDTKEKGAANKADKVCPSH